MSIKRKIRLPSLSRRFQSIYLKNLKYS